MKQTFREQIAAFVLNNFTEDEIESIEENAGSIWIDLKNGETYSIMVLKCEPLPMPEEPIEGYNPEFSQQF